MNKEEEYKKLFLEETTENFERLNNLLIKLEKDHSNKGTINAIFRIIHTLKGNSMAMGYNSIAELSHVVEDVMVQVDGGKIQMDTTLFEGLFKSIDKLGAMVNALETGKKVAYLGIKTKLEVLLKNALKSDESNSDQAAKNEEDTDQSDHEHEEEEEQSITFSDTIQMPVRKMDDLMNLVSQLITVRDSILSKPKNNEFTSDFNRLKQIISDLQYNVLKARMLPVSFLFNKFHRIIRDAAIIENKKVELQLKGTEVEIDRNILKAINDAMIHIVRNAVSHGIEDAETRKKRKKPEVGCVTIEASYERNGILICITDDGGGIDPATIRKKLIEKEMIGEEVVEKIKDQDIIRQIFKPGFSNTDKVTSMSGRGVGMDVVKRAVETVGGQVTVDSEVEKGTSINLLLPSSLALKMVLLIEQGGHEYAIPLSFTEEVSSVTKKEFHKISRGVMMEYQGEPIPVFFLKTLLEADETHNIHEEGLFQLELSRIDENEMLNVIIVSYSGRHIALVVEQFISRFEVIEKPLPKLLGDVKIWTGASILGNGHVCPVLDVAGILDIQTRTFVN